MMSMRSLNSIIDDNDINEFVVAFMATQLTNSRVFKWKTQRLNWEEHRAMLIHKRKFHKMYRMTATAFDDLVEIVRPVVEVDVRKSMASTPLSNSTIFPALVVAAGLRWAAGGSYHDITTYLGISDAYSIGAEISSSRQCFFRMIPALPSYGPKLWTNAEKLLLL